jgi:putrescine transport system ATP-binding protein
MAYTNHPHPEEAAQQPFRRTHASDPSSAPHLLVDRVTKRFGAVAAVDDVSLTVESGEFFALLGPSGCGKTTLLRLLAGFETPDAGRVLIDGVDMTGVPPYARPVNMMFQSYALFPHMSVAQNVGFGLRQEGVAKAVLRERVAAMLDLVQMADLAGRKPSQLSGGQRQRVALARALIKQPKLLLLDEPLAALDRKLREQTQFELVRVQERVGITFIVVTHDQAEAMTMASRIAVMERGRLRQIGTPGEIYEAPVSRFVADFIGAVNLLTGEVREARDGALVVASPSVGSFRVLGPALPTGTVITAALRPEKIALGRAPTPEGDNRHEGVVREIAYLGGLSLYRVELRSGAILRVSLPNTVRLAGPSFARGDRVHLSWPAASAVVLPE